ncbi:MAG: PorV/PorQ family protein [bacterium]
MKKIALLTGMLIIAGSVCYAGFSKDDAGTSAAQFLKLGAGARATGMGEAYGAVADDASALYWNPAGMAQLDNIEVSLMHAEWVEDISYEWGSVAVPAGGAGVIGLGVQYLSYGDMKELDTNGIEQGDFSPTDMAVNLGYGLKLTDSIFLGINAKYISCQIKEKASTTAADVGLIKKFMDKKFSLGVAFQNIGGKMKFESEEDDLPLNFKIGSAYKINKSLLLALDVNAPKDNETAVGLGAEYIQNISNDFSVAGRVGYNSRTKDVEGLNGLSLGVGGNIFGYMVDYSYVPLGDIGDTHRISLGISFK